MFGNKNDVDIRPWYANDFYKTLSSIYVAFTTSNPMRHDEKVRAGFVAGLSSTALAVGVDPSTFIKPSDIELVHRAQNGEL